MRTIVVSVLEGEQPRTGPAVSRGRRSRRQGRPAADPRDPKAVRGAPTIRAKDQTLLAPMIVEARGPPASYRRTRRTRGMCRGGEAPQDRLVTSDALGETCEPSSFEATNETAGAGEVRANAELGFGRAGYA
jgi:hypothetical protein